MQLSNRLQAVADLVSLGNRVADVGCDHAYTAIYLVENGISPHVVAMDIHEGPLAKAVDNIVKYGYQNQIETRKSDGLDKLVPEEVDTILIGGMGGALTVQILQAHMEVVNSVRELILQPQSQIHLVRKMLDEEAFLITDENMIKEDGKYYMMMKAKPMALVKQASDFALTKEEHFHFGKLLLERQNPVLFEFLMKEHKRCSSIVQRLLLLSETTEQTLLRQKEMVDEMKLIDSGLEFYV